jgi:hypothetical protein
MTLPSRAWRKSCNRFFLTTLFLALPITSTHAQNIPTAYKSEAISVFAGYENANPAYASGRNNGAAFGVDFTRYFHRLPIAPSLEARVNLNSSNATKERTYLIGLQGMVNILHVLHPYADFLVGPGTIHFNQNTTYLGDNSIVFNYGGGVDLDLIRNFQAKFDYQYQSWTLGTNDHITPTILLIGINCRIPFRDHDKQSDYQ